MDGETFTEVSESRSVVKFTVFDVTMCSRRGKQLNYQRNVFCCWHKVKWNRRKPVGPRERAKLVTSIIELTVLSETTHTLTHTSDSHELCWLPVWWRVQLASHHGKSLNCVRVVLLNGEISDSLSDGMKLLLESGQLQL